MSKRKVYVNNDAPMFNSKTKKEIGERIRKCCKDAGITITELAAYVGVTAVQMSRIMSGESECKLSYLWDISKYLRADIRFLCYGYTPDTLVAMLFDFLEDESIEDLLRIRRVIYAMKGKENRDLVIKIDRYLSYVTGDDTADGKGDDKS